MLYTLMFVSSVSALPSISVPSIVVVRAAEFWFCQMRKLRSIKPCDHCQCSFMQRNEVVETYVMEPECGISRRGINILHDSADTVVTPCVSTALSAAGHIGKSAARVTGVNHGLASVDGLGSIAIAGEAVRLVA